MTAITGLIVGTVQGAALLPMLLLSKEFAYLLHRVESKKSKSRTALAVLLSAFGFLVHGAVGLAFRQATTDPQIFGKYWAAGLPVGLLVVTLAMRLDGKKNS